MQGSRLLPDEAPAQTPSTAVMPTEPLITGEALYLWTGAGAVLFILVLLLILLGRWRAGRRARERALNTEFFQPAGEDAEITFDDADRSAPAPLNFDLETPRADLPPETEKPKRASPFAGLFARRSKNEPIENPEFLEVDVESEDFASVQIERSDEGDTPSSAVADWRDAEWRTHTTDESAAGEAEDLARRASELDAHARWRALEDERRRLLEDADHRRVDEGAAARPLADREQAGFTHEGVRAPHDDIVRTLSEVEEALHVQREAIQAETRSLLESFARRFSDRLDSLAHSMERRAAYNEISGEVSGRADNGLMLEEIARRLDDHRNEVSAAISALSRRLDQAVVAQSDSATLHSELAEMRRSRNGDGTPAAPSVQLADIVRNALAPNGYELDAMLPNNRRADCLIKLSRPPGPIAIDASFPVEAFHALHERRGAAVENEFRRIALRHIVDIAERMICPGFTADSAILFLPSESMATELHARFPDLIQDSYRARVWIVSPTTLMATLHTLSAFLRDAPKRESSLAAETAARRALSEVERLSERISMLEKGATQPRIEPKELRSANDAPERSQIEPVREEQAAAFDNATPATEEKRGDLYADEDPGDPRLQTQSRPPFPLR